MVRLREPTPLKSIIKFKEKNEKKAVKFSSIRNLSEKSCCKNKQS